MSDIYNPESDVIARMEALAVEAARLRRKRDAVTDPAERRIYEQQLAEAEQRFESLRQRVRRRRAHVA